MANREDEAGFERFEQFLNEWSRRDFLRRMSMGAAFTAFMAGGAEWLAACGGSGTPSPVTSGKPGGHIVEGDISDIGNINPIFSNDSASNIIKGLAYDPVVTFDAKANRVPLLASELPKVESDNLTYTAKLRKDAKWSDGQPITADDVVFTFDLMTKDQYKDVKSRYRSELTQYVDSVTAPDPYTVVYKTKTVYAKFYDSFIATQGILPKHIWSKLDNATINSTPLNQVPEVVSGAFIPVKWDKGSQYVMKSNPTYYRGKPYLDQYVKKVVSDQVAIANQLKTGELDAGVYDKSQHDSLATAQNVDRVVFDVASYDYFVPNLDTAKTPKAAFFSDVNVRRALITAVNRKQVADKIYFGLAQPADSCMAAAMWAHVTPKTQYPYDPKKAEQMLDDAGWKKGPDGIRAKNGVQMAWELRTNVGNKVRESLIQVLADAWNQIGCKVATNPVQFPQLVTQLSQTRDFEMIVIGIYSSSPDPDQTQNWASTSIGGGALNGGAYKNSKVDDLLKQALAVVDRTKRKELYAQLQEILMEDVPAPLVTFPRATWGVSKRVKNFNVGSWNQYAERPWMKDVYVTDGK